jgi:hypothetical protein
MTRPSAASWLLAPVVWFLLAGCADVRQGRTADDDLRSACASAAHAHDLAAERASAGDLSPAAFARLDDDYDAIADICRRVILGGPPPTDEEQATITAYGSAAR